MIATEFFTVIGCLALCAGVGAAIGYQVGLHDGRATRQPGGDE
jgi:hypothetical protein